MPELFGKTVKLNSVLMLIAALILAIIGEVGFGAGLIVGAIWSTVNFYLTLNLFDIAILHKSGKRLLLLLLIKFPVLYLLGFLILAGKFFPVLSLLIGIASILLVMGVASIWPKQGTCSKNCRI